MDIVAERALLAPWLRTGLLVVAILEMLNALMSLPALFGGVADMPGPGLGGVVVSATMVLHPVFAVAALVFYVRGHLDRAVLALAGVVLLAWLRLLPSLVLHGLEAAGPAVVLLHAVLRVLVFPVLALAAINLARRGERLAVAALFVCLPTAIDVLGTIAFGIGVAIYGF